MKLKMDKGFIYKILIFFSIAIIVMFAFFLSRLVILIIATPFAYSPQTFNTTNDNLIETSIFDLNEKIVIRANISDDLNDLQFSIINLTASNSTFIYSNELMSYTLISCGVNCSVWEKNYTLSGGDPAGVWIVNITANDTIGNSAINSTTFNVVQYVEITLSQALIDGISFGSVYSGTIENPALNNTGSENSGTQYNLTVGPSSNTNITFFHKVNETVNGLYINASSSITNETYGFSSNMLVDDSWKTIGDSSINCTNIGVGAKCYIRYFFDVAIGSSPQYFERTYSYCAVYFGGSSTLCE